MKCQKQAARNFSICREIWCKVLCIQKRGAERMEKRREEKSVAVRRLVSVRRMTCGEGRVVLAARVELCTEVRDVVEGTAPWWMG